MHNRTKGAIYGSEALATAAPSASVMDVVAMVQAMAITKQWDHIDDAIKATAFRAGCSEPDGLTGLTWVIGYHDALCTAALETDQTRIAFRELLAVRDRAALDDPVVRALLDDSAPIPSDEDSLRRMTNIARHRSAIGRVAVLLARIIAQSSAENSAAARAWERLASAATAEPLNAARVIIALHRAGAWRTLAMSDNVTVRSGCDMLVGSAARLPDAAINCMREGLMVIGLERVIPQARAAEAIAGIARRWEELTDDERRSALWLAQQSPEAALELAQCIGPSDALAKTIAATGDVDAITRYLKVIAPFGPSPDHINAVVNNVTSVSPIMAEFIGLHPRLVYEALQSPHLCAQTLVSAGKRDDFNPQSESARMLRDIAMTNGLSAASILSVFGCDPEAIDAALQTPQAWPEALTTLHAHGAALDARIVAVIVKQFAQLAMQDAALADRIAATIAALWDNVPDVIAARVTQSPELASEAIAIAARHNRSAAIPAAILPQLLSAAAKTETTRLKAASDFGDHPILWNMHQQEAEIKAAEERTPFAQRRVIAANALGYLNALIIGGRWETTPEERKHDILIPCLGDPQGIAFALRLAGDHPLIIAAMRDARERRPVEWAIAWHEFSHGAPMPPDLLHALTTPPPRNPHIAVQLTRFVGWNETLMRRAINAPYSDARNYVEALREANAWTAAIRDCMHNWDDSARKLIWTMVTTATCQDVERIVDALDEDDMSIGVALSHPIITGAYVQRHPQALNDPVIAASLFAATANPRSIDDFDDAAFERIAKAADASPWSAYIVSSLGILGAGIDSLTLDAETTLLYMMRHQQQLLPDESLRLALCLGQAPGDVQQAAISHGIKPISAAPSARRR